VRANCLPGRSCNASFLSLEGARNCARMHACAHTPSNLERFYARMHSCMQKGMKPHSSSTQLSLRFAARIMAACTLPAQQSSAASWDARGPRCARCARELRAIIATPVLRRAGADSSRCCQLRLPWWGLGLPRWACDMGFVQPRLASLVGLHDVLLPVASPRRRHDGASAATRARLGCIRRAAAARCGVAAAALRVGASRAAGTGPACPGWWPACSILCAGGATRREGARCAHGASRVRDAGPRARARAGREMRPRAARMSQEWGRPFAACRDERPRSRARAGDGAGLRARREEWPPRFCARGP